MTGFNNQPHSELERSLFESVEAKTPDYIKNNKLINLDEKGEIVFRLKKEHLNSYDAESNPEGLNLYEWFKNYAKEAEVSTAGIRGPQNILYPHDTRFPINMIGIMLATEAKALVAKELYPNSELMKLAGCEVRYNSQEFLELIARIQASHGIKTIVPKDRKTIPIWLASFLAFKLDLLGGEYITSSHGISVKNATKDLNSQGSQYLPEESMLFVDKIKFIFDTVEQNGYYDIKIASNDNPLITEELMTTLNDGVDLYKQYLLDGVAKDANLNLIKSLKENIVIENVGGSAYRTLSRILKSLNIESKFVWLNENEDPFFNGIGKYDTDPKGNKTFYDYSVDATVIAKDNEGKPYFPVINSLNYSEKLKNYPVSTVVLITDPDHDRLTVCQVEKASNIEFLKSLGIDYVQLDEERVLTVYTANQSFLMIMNFWAESLKKEGLFDKHPRFIIKTTASARSWDEWARHNDIKVVNVPVGFKEIANIMKKVEKQITENPQKDVIVTDVLGNDINLGVNPKLIFGGEESGGMIIGSESLITSFAGRKAIAMREKSATEAIIVASALTSYLERQSQTMSQYLANVFANNNIISKYDIREDISYYNESEPDIEKLKLAKIEGEGKRTQNDKFYLTMAVAKKQGKIGLEQIKSILADAFNELNFSNLIDVKFVGDGTYLEFTDKFIEIRPSGTDAKTKAYGAGASKDEIKKFAQIMGNYSGELTDLYKQIVDMELYEYSKELSLKDYAEFTNKDANNDKFVIPNYKKTLNFSNNIDKESISTKYNLKDIFGYVKNDENWVKKIAIGGFLSLVIALLIIIPIIFFFVLLKSPAEFKAMFPGLPIFCGVLSSIIGLVIIGFIVETGHNYIKNPKAKLPNWSNFNSLLFTGFKSIFGSTLLFLPLVFVFIVFIIVSIKVEASGVKTPEQSEYYALYLFTEIAYQLLNLFLTIVFFSFNANFLKELNVFEFLNYPKAFKNIKNYFTEYIVLVLLLFAINMLYGLLMLLLIISVIGILVIPFVNIYINIVNTILTARFAQIAKKD